MCVRVRIQGTYACARGYRCVSSRQLFSPCILRCGGPDCGWRMTHITMFMAERWRAAPRPPPRARRRRPGTRFTRRSPTFRPQEASAPSYGRKHTCRQRRYATHSHSKQTHTRDKYTLRHTITQAFTLITHTHAQTNSPRRTITHAFTLKTTPAYTRPKWLFGQTKRPRPHPSQRDTRTDKQTDGQTHPLNRHECP